MKRLLLYSILLISVIKSQEMKEFYIYPDYTLDTNENFDNYRLNLNFTKDSTISYVSGSIYDFQKTTIVSQFDDKMIIENTSQAIDYSKNIELAMLSLSKYSSDTSKKYTAYGYRLISRQNKLQNIGKTLLLVDEMIYSEIKPELENYIDILKLSGIDCEFRLAPRSEVFNPKKAAETKDIVKSYYNTNKALENIIIIGRVAFAMSGHYTPDGHTDESFGAWPTDLYYSTLGGTWTDVESDTNNPFLFPYHKNIAGDGKFDNGYLPQNVKFNVGRIDMYNLTFFKESEVELLKRYFRKDINFRKGLVRPKNNAIMDYGFGDGYIEKFPTEAMINYSAIFGDENYVWKKARNVMEQEEYLFFWGAAPGAVDNIYDIVYAEEISNQSFNSVFTTVFGSRACEWASQNNIMRSIIASEPMALTSRWGCRPFYYTFFLGVGKTIGECHSFSANGTMESNGSITMNRTVHQTLLGDPTLKMYYPDMPSNFEISKSENTYLFSWQNNPKSFAYNIYYKDNTHQFYTLLNSDWIRNNKFEIQNNFAGEPEFILKSIQKVENNQGYYFEESIGVRGDKFNYIDDNINIHIYPNPTNEEINFGRNVSYLQITNLLGEIVFENTNTFNKINLKDLNLNEGVYFINYKLNNSIFTEKIIFYK